jgi:tryptophan synthase alpha chain
MSRIAARFGALRQAGRTALIPYITAGDPSLAATVPLLHGLVGAGADILELGVPFSDPMADGPVIQAACERALAQGVTLRQVLDLVSGFRSQDQNTPLVLMGYLNPLEAMGYESFASAAQDAGVDGLITVDMPPEESQGLGEALSRRNIDPVYLVSPTTPPARIEQVCAVAQGFVYYVSLKGTTGSDALDIAAVERKLREIRAFTDLPLGVGFGIRNAQAAGRVAGVADAVVVGSAVVSRVHENAADLDLALAAVTGLVREMRAAMDGK